MFTDSPFVMLRAEEHHRGHAQAEQVFADWSDGPLAHLPSGSFPANAAWLTLAAITAKDPRTRRTNVSGRKTTPATNRKISIPGLPSGKRSPNSGGGFRLRKFNK